MTRVAITPVTLTTTGYNLTDSAGFTVMATGANNGITVDFDLKSVIALKNTTGGAAVYTFKVVSPGQFSGKGSTVGDVTVTVAAAKSWLYQPSEIMRQSDGKVWVDCDVAGSILVLTPQ